MERDPFTISRPAGGTSMIALRDQPILACDDQYAEALCALLNTGYNVGMKGFEKTIVEPSSYLSHVERFGTTDAGYEERILDAEIAAGERPDWMDEEN